MARTAVIFTVIFSLFLLSDARLLPDGGAAESFVAGRNPHEDGDRVDFPLQFEESSDASLLPADIPSRVGLSLRRPIKFRCRHARPGRPFVTPLPLGRRRHERVILLGDGAAGFSRIPRGFPGERRPFPTWHAGSRPGPRQEVGRLAYGTIEADERRGWMPEMEHKEEREEGGFMNQVQELKPEGRFTKGFPNHEKDREEGGLKERFWEFLNRF